MVECRKCGCNYKANPIWDFTGYGYDTKCAVCPECGQIRILKYKIDENFDVNNDPRFYEYRKDVVEE